MKVEEIYNLIEDYLKKAREYSALKIPDLSEFSKIERDSEDFREELFKYGQVLIDNQNLYSEVRERNLMCRELLMVNPPDMTPAILMKFRKQVENYIALLRDVELTITKRIGSIEYVIETLRSMGKQR